MKLKRLIFLILGCVCLGLGCIGVALPILPTVPFFLATVFCFANSSQKLHDWFVSTKLYKKHLDTFVKKKGMTVKTKLGIIIPVTLVMGVGFFMMVRAGVIVPSVILAVVWVCHILYFGCGVKTIREGQQAAALGPAGVHRPQPPDGGSVTKGNRGIRTGRKSAFK